MKKVKVLLKTLVIVIIISIGTFGCDQNDSSNNSIINSGVSKNESFDNSTTKQKIDNKNNIKNDDVENEGNNTLESITESSNDDMFEGYQFIEVDGGDLSGNRESNVVVDIGFGDREYYAFTNEYGQLVKVIADEIILQNEETEKVLSTGRYYSDEAKVPGVESTTLDEGHVIADSLGGVSNAYNITPQNSTLNRHGDQAYMEKMIREAGGCTDFVAIITYPDTDTQIPNHYSYTYTLKGNIIKDEFDNINPDEENSKLEETVPIIEQNNSSDATGISIIEIDKKAEYVLIKNNSNQDVDLEGWKIISVTGGQTFIFPSYVLAAGESVKIAGYDAKSTGDFVWEEGKGVWNNSKSDPGELYNDNNELIDNY